MAVGVRTLTLSLLSHAVDVQPPDATYRPAGDSGLVTQLLREAADGRAGALDEALPLVYDELRRLAAAVRQQGTGATLDTSALVHEAYLRLAQTDGAVPWAGRQHFLRVAARAMRQVLVRNAEHRGAAKRGGGVADVTLADDLHGRPPTDDEVLDLDQALQRLDAINTRQAAVVEVRFFAGLTVEETADVLGVSAPTVARDWRLARVWLARELAP